MDEKTSKTAQQLRNIGYAISAVLAALGIAFDESLIDPIVLGVIGGINLITNVVAWWYSRKKFVVKDVSEPPVAS